MLTFRFDNTYARLPERFYARVSPTAVRAPSLVKVNEDLARTLSIDPDALATEGVDVLAGSRVPEGSEPIAQAYAGHQFGSFVPQLGDGRAILLGEIVGSDGLRRDLHLKGAGRTPFSRQGDGRAALGPVLREYIVSEAMAALGVPTTRTLAAVTTGEVVVREQRLPGAVLARVAASHIRVGTFEYFAARSDESALRRLTAYTLERHYAPSTTPREDALMLLERAIQSQAELIARWLGVGFVHGVMNTDNTLISGETIDYGPCAFLDEYDPKKRFSSIDYHGRYAFGNQPAIAQWNLARFAETLLPLISSDEEEAVREATQRLERFPALFEANYIAMLRQKLGLSRVEDEDRALATELLQGLAADAVDYTLFFRQLCSAAEDSSADAEIARAFQAPEFFWAWARRWRERLTREEAPPSACAGAMRRVNPAFIPRNHRVEEAIEAAVSHGRFTEFETLLRVVAKPFVDQPEFAHLSEPPRPEQRVRQTFCGT